MNNSLKQMFTCPLSLKNIIDPVMAEDGFIYESEYIEKHFESETKSPVTHEEIGKKLIRSPRLLNIMITYYIQYDKLEPGYYDNIINFIVKSDNSIKKKLFKDDKFVDYLIDNYKVDTGFILENYLVTYNRIDKLTNAKLNINEKVVHHVCGMINYFSSSKQYNIIKLFVDHGVDFNVRDDDGNWPVNYICSSANNLDVIRLLLSRDVDFNVSEDDGSRPVHYICSRGNNFDAGTQLDAIKLLLSHDVNFDVSEDDGTRPIHYVCSQNNKLDAETQFEAIKLLLDHGVNFDVFDGDGWTPVRHITSHANNLNKEGQLEIIKLLSDKGKKID